MAWALIPALGRLKPAESLKPAWSTWRVPVSHSETTDGLLMINPAAPGCSVLSDMSREMGLCEVWAVPLLSVPTGQADPEAFTSTVSCQLITPGVVMW